MKLKICGIRDEKNLQELCELDIDYIGLIFAPSKRQVNLEKAKLLSQIARKKAKKVVGVFLDESDEFIYECLHCLDIVQRYKACSKFFYEKIRDLKKELWQVVSVKDELILPSEKNYDYLLFDTLGKKRGGNGFCFDWKLLKNEKNFILAGGIGLDNINEALKTGAFVLDINSKVENEKLLKDVKLIKQIIQRVKDE